MKLRRCHIGIQFGQRLYDRTKNQSYLSLVRQKKKKCAFLSLLFFLSLSCDCLCDNKFKSIWLKNSYYRYGDGPKLNTFMQTRQRTNGDRYQWQWHRRYLLQN